MKFFSHLQVVYDTLHFLTINLFHLWNSEKIYNNVDLGNFAFSVEAFPKTSSTYLTQRGDTSKMLILYTSLFLTRNYYLFYRKFFNINTYFRE